MTTAGGRAGEEVAVLETAVRRLKWAGTGAGAGALVVAVVLARAVDLHLPESRGRGDVFYLLLWAVPRRAFVADAQHPAVQVGAGLYVLLATACVLLFVAAAVVGERLRRARAAHARAMDPRTRRRVRRSREREARLARRAQPPARG